MHDEQEENKELLNCIEEKMAEAQEGKKKKRTRKEAKEETKLEDGQEREEEDEEKKKPKKTKMEEVPMSNIFDTLNKFLFKWTKQIFFYNQLAKLSPEELALGELITNSKKLKSQILDDSYNR